MIGQGLWKRYDGNRGKPWRHAKIDENWKAKGLVEMARDGRKPNDGMKYTVMDNHYRNQLTNAINNIKRECSNVGNCFHDNYISIPVGEHNNHVFSPGLNQLWVILDPGRHDVLANVVVGSQADDASCAYYIGGSNNNGFVTQMSFDFTTFSEATNPITFRTALSTSSGLAALYMDIKHTGGNQYIHVAVTCAYGTIGGWKARSSFWQWGWKHVQKEFGLFVDKGTQIYDLCHCYHRGNANLVSCTTASGGSSIWDNAIGDVVKFVHSAFLQSSRLWVHVPTVYYSNGGSASCWSHYDSMLASSHKVAGTNEGSTNDNAAACGTGKSVISITLGANSEFGEWCQDACVDTSHEFSTKGHEHAMTLEDKTCSERGFTQLHHEVKAEFRGNSPHEGPYEVPSQASDSECNLHFISDGTFCEHFCLGHGTEDGFAESVRMEHHGMEPGNCPMEFDYGLGWHDVKIYGPAGKVLLQGKL
jgi:hypothetical protein